MPLDTSKAFLKRAFDFIQRHELIRAGDHILVGVSGGADSTALLHILLSLRDPLDISRISVLHFDHQLRGAASTEDKSFVKALAERLDLPFFSKSEDVLSYQKTHRLSLEMAARECRHRFFREALDECRAQKVALGHTANDQAEELLLRLFRGTGPSGLAGMHPGPPHGIIRPILFATRPEVLDYLKSIELSHRDDLSNEASFCQRNALRLEVFPILDRRFHGRIVETLSRHSQLVRDEETYWTLQVESCWPAICSERSSTHVSLHLKGLIDLHPALLRRVLRYAIDMIGGKLFGIYSVHIEDLSILAHRRVPGKRLNLPRGLRAEIEGDCLVLSYTTTDISKLPLEAPPIIFIPQEGDYIFHPYSIKLRIESGASFYQGAKPPTSSHLVRMDAEKVFFPLLVRFWQPGDRFSPLGLGGSKKLQDFFTDTKVPRSERKSIPLLCDREKICWVIGHRLDDRIKVTEKTRSLLIIEAKIP